MDSSDAYGRFLELQRNLLAGTPQPSHDSLPRPSSAHRIPSPPPSRHSAQSPSQGPSQRRPRSLDDDDVEEDRSPGRESRHGRTRPGRHRSRDGDGRHRPRNRSRHGHTPPSDAVRSEVPSYHTDDVSGGAQSRAPTFDDHVTFERTHRTAPRYRSPRSDPYGRRQDTRDNYYDQQEMMRPREAHGHHHRDRGRDHNERPGFNPVAHVPRRPGDGSRR